MGGIATPNEIAFVGLLFLMVLFAPKVPRWGEAIGRWLGGPPPSPPEPRGRGAEGGSPGEAHGSAEGATPNERRPASP